MAILCLIWLIIGATLTTGASFVGKTQMDLEDLKRLCYPDEYNRNDMMYISTKTSEIKESLEKSSVLSIKRLHMTVSPTKENWEIDLHAVYSLNNLTEL